VVWHRLELLIELYGAKLDQHFAAVTTCTAMKRVTTIAICTTLAGSPGGQDCREGILGETGWPRLGYGMMIAARCRLASVNCHGFLSCERGEREYMIGSPSTSLPSLTGGGKLKTSQSEEAIYVGRFLD
jgi:hypothetical protein